MIKAADGKKVGHRESIRPLPIAAKLKASAKGKEYFMITTNEVKLVAFHGSPNLKDKYIVRVRKHREADQLKLGIGWDPKKKHGCSIGCMFNAYDHAAGEAESGIHRAILRLQDGLHESVPMEMAIPADLAMPSLTERFLAAIRPGADLSLVLPRFFVWLLVDPRDGVIRFVRTAQAREAIQQVADLYQKKINGITVSEAEWRAARDAARAAARDAAWAAARLQSRVKQANKLIELLEAA